MIDLFSVLLGAIGVGIPMALLLIWVAAKAYTMGWRDCKKGEWHSDHKKDPAN